VTQATQADFRKILIVDDNPDIHRDFAKILDSSDATDVLDKLEEEIFGSPSADQPYQGYQYRLFFATQGKQALDMVTAAVDCDDPFLLAFVDMRMPPGWDGLETIERLWQADPLLQIVLCTAYSDYSWHVIQQQLGPTSNLLILKKPFDVSEVAQMAAALTEKWRLSKQAAIKEETLAYRVAQRTADLEEANRQLKEEILVREQLEKQLLRAQKMEAIGTLAAGVAHDLNNILSGIVSYPDLLLMDIDENNPMHGKLKLIQQSGQKAAAIVQDMLTMGRRGVFTRPFESENDDRGVFGEPRIQGPAPPFCQCAHRRPTDGRIRERSGIRIPAGKMHHEPGEQFRRSPYFNRGTVAIELLRRTVSRPHEGYVTIPAGTYIVMSVADDGPGIAEKDLEHIFEPLLHQEKDGPQRHRLRPFRGLGGGQRPSRIHRRHQPGKRGHTLRSLFSCIRYARFEKSG
jgi:two-component system NtrC family sensor kinase